MTKLDWTKARPANDPNGTKQPGEEISQQSAEEDRLLLEYAEKQRREAQKRSSLTKNQRRQRKHVLRPDTMHERKLRQLVASKNLRAFGFSARYVMEGTKRAFISSDFQIKVYVDLNLPGKRHLISPGNPKTFRWVSLRVGPGALAPTIDPTLAAILLDLVNRQNSLKQGEKNG